MKKVILFLVCLDFAVGCQTCGGYESITKESLIEANYKLKNIEKTETILEVQQNGNTSLSGIAFESKAVVYTDKNSDIVHTPPLNSLGK